MSEIKGPVKVGFGDADDSLRYRVVVGCPGAIVCEVPADIDGPQEDRDRAHRWAQEIADALNAREEHPLSMVDYRRLGDAYRVQREELALLRYHFDLQYSAVLQSVDLVEEHAAQVREAARKVMDWRDAHPEALEVRSDG